MYRIVHWGTGNVGGASLRAILDRQDFELVGHYAHSADKVGKDSATLVGRPACGITTTDDIDALIALKPDVLTWFGNAMVDPLGSTRTMARFLEAGINVVTTSLYEAGARESTPDAFLAILDPACEKGQSSFYSTGFDPGFATTQLPVTAYSIAHRVDLVRLQEFANYGNYPDEATMRNIMGFGCPLDAQTAMSDGAFARRVWTATVDDNMRALGLEPKPSEFRFEYHTAPCLEDRDTMNGRMDKGSMSVVWLRLIGMVDGEDRVILEHINWMDPRDIPAEWPQPPLFRGGPAEVGYRTRIIGDPNVEIETSVESAKDGMFCTGLHAVNGIPMVVGHAPGIVSQRHILPYGPGPLKPKGA